MAPVVANDARSDRSLARHPILRKLVGCCSFGMALSMDHCPVFERCWTSFGMLLYVMDLGLGPNNLAPTNSASFRLAIVKKFSLDRTKNALFVFHSGAKHIAHLLNEKVVSLLYHLPAVAIGPCVDAISKPMLRRRRGVALVFRLCKVVPKLIERLGELVFPRGSVVVHEGVDE